MAKEHGKRVKRKARSGGNAFKPDVSCLKSLELKIKEDPTTSMTDN
uniref:Uncharacterized protein n=1 Tax=Lepeophtheirus salmonis TaxID=72036 RepID=A0A0K2TXN6_LEPSM